MILALLLACGTAPPWTDASALGPHLARLDTDGDGRVSAAEYGRTRREGPPFATADDNGDGALGAEELALLVRAQDPATFDGEAAPAAPIAVAVPEGVGAGSGAGTGESAAGGTGEGAGEGAAGGAAQPPVGEARHVQELLLWMGDALRAAGRPAPGTGAIEAAIQSGRLESAETTAVLAAMRPKWEGLGWTWPEEGRGGGSAPGGQPTPGGDPTR